MKEYKTEKVSIKDIKLDGDNPNKLDPDMENRLGRSMKEFGNTQDIIVDKNTMVLADGEHRLKQYIKEGISEIPVKLIPFKNDAHRRAYRQAANKIRGLHDDDLDASEYLKIIEGGEKDLLKMTTGLTISEVEKHLRKQNLLSKEEDFDAEEEYKKIEEPVTKPGDIWKLGESRLMCGDATESESVGLLMTDEKADMVFTDPPYNINWSGGRQQLAHNKINKGKIIGDNVTSEQFDSYIKAVNRKDINEIYICCNASNMKQTLNALEEYNAIITWDKQNAGLGYMKYRRQVENIIYIRNIPFKKGEESDVDLWSIPKDATTKYEHVTQKPVALALRAINNSSKEEDIVLDVFGGSGTTLIACEKLNRRCFMMEIDPIYCDVIKMRFEKFTDLKAERIVPKASST